MDKNNLTMKVEFVKGATGSESLLTDDVRHIVFAGRSNVGKSSTINALVLEKIARPSSTPGKTREMNFYRWSFNDETVYLVDLPGYGYAKLSRDEREKMFKRSQYYIEQYKGLIQGVCIIIDAQVGITDSDQEFIGGISLDIPILIVANKSDKLNQKERSAQERKLREEGYDYCFISASTGKGVSELRHALWSDH